MKKTIIIPIAIFASILSGCHFSINSGDTANVLHYTEEGIDFSEERAVGKFNSFSLSGPFNVYFVQSDKQKILVEGNEESVKKTITEVSDNELKIKLKRGLYGNLVLRVTVFSPYIEEIETFGSGKVHCGNIDIPGTDLELTTMGSGGITAENITCEELSLSTSGSGGIKITGKTVASDDVDADTQGSGSIRLSTVQSKDLDVSTAGSGSISIEEAEVMDEMELSTAGSGSISVNGRCSKVDASTIGSGSIRGNLKYNKIEKSEIGSGRIRL